MGTASSNGFAEVNASGYRCVIRSWNQSQVSSAAKPCAMLASTRWPTPLCSRSMSAVRMPCRAVWVTPKEHQGAVTNGGWDVGAIRSKALNTPILAWTTPSYALICVNGPCCPKPVIDA